MIKMDRPHIIGSCGMDGTARLFDIKSQKNVLAIPAHPQEVLSFDFNKYQDVLVTSSGDNTIKTWDLRNI